MRPKGFNIFNAPCAIAYGRRDHLAFLCLALHLPISKMKTSLFIAAQALFFGASTAKNFDVNVGKGGNLRFEPESLDHVVAGDTVTYHFFSQVFYLIFTEKKWDANEDRTTLWHSQHLMTHAISRTAASSPASSPLSRTMKPLRRHFPSP